MNRKPPDPRAQAKRAALNALTARVGLRGAIFAIQARPCDSTVTGRWPESSGGEVQRYYRDGALHRQGSSGAIGGALLRQVTRAFLPASFPRAPVRGQECRMALS